MPTHTYFVYKTPFGPITIGANGSDVCAVELGNVALPGSMKPSDVTNECSTQILEYFAGKRTAFDIPIELHGTAFQNTVWRALCDIPYGQVRTASDIATAIGRPQSQRSVGRAVRENPIAIIVPAHRVVSASQADKSASLREAFRRLEARYA